MNFLIGIAAAAIVALLIGYWKWNGPDGQFYIWRVK